MTTTTTNPPSPTSLRCVVANTESNTFFLYFVTFRSPRAYIMKLPEMFQQQLFLYGHASVIEPVECLTRENQSIVVVRFIVCPEADGAVDLFLLRTILQQAAEWFNMCWAYSGANLLPATATPNVQFMACSRTSLLHCCHDPTTTSEQNSPLWECHVDSQFLVFSWAAPAATTPLASKPEELPPPPPLCLLLFQSLCTKKAYDVRQRFREVRRRYVDTIKFAPAVPPPVAVAAAEAATPAPMDTEAAATTGAAVEDLWSFLKTGNIMDYFGLRDTNGEGDDDVLAGVPDIPPPPDARDPRFGSNSSSCSSSESGPSSFDANAFFMSACAFSTTI